MKDKSDEIICIKCDGTGLVPVQIDDAEESICGVTECDSCNGHGVVLFINNHVVVFARDNNSPFAKRN